MTKILNILVPTDFSKGSQFAYRYANDLAVKFGGKVDLIHVVPTFRYLTESLAKLGLPIDMDKDVYPRLMTDSKQQLEQDLAEYFVESVRGKGISVIERKVEDAINERTEHGSYDLVLIGSQGANENAFFNGTITERVIRFSKIPVLTVPPSIPDHPVRKIIVPLDGSAKSLECLPFAVYLVNKLGGELTLTHILEIFGTELENEERFGELDIFASAREIILKKTDDFLRKSKEVSAFIRRGQQDSDDTLVVNDEGETKEYNLKTHISKGISAHFEILDYAHSNSDMIVMTTHGRSGFEHLFLGSTAETISRQARMPVLTLKPKQKIHSK